MSIDTTHFRQRVEKLANGHVLVIGDVILDRYIYGEAHRISPEAPVPILRIASESEMLGGAGNVVRNLNAVGSAVTLVSVVGNDAEGGRIKKLLAALPRVRSMLIVDSTRQTSVKTRFVANDQQQLLRTDHESTTALRTGVEAEVAENIKIAVTDADVVVLSDYAKGVLTQSIITTAISAAKAERKPSIVDPKSRDFAKYRGATLIAPNRKELAEASGLPTITESDVEAAANSLRESYGFEAVLATLGKHGMTLVELDGVYHNIPNRALDVFDVSGAGDTVVATMAAGLAGGLRLFEAVPIAQCAAGVVVGKPGTAVAYPDEIIAQLQYEDGRAAGGKILNRDRTLDRVVLWRRQRLRVGFTNGCFDLLHPGHIHLLKQARAACDRLVVGLNTDASVRRLKGNGRPVQSEAARATVLAGLADVDLVTMFEEDTPEALIAALRPDVLVKGADYTMDTVVGADLVKGYGGKIVLAELLPGHSTSATVARLK